MTHTLSVHKVSPVTTNSFHVYSSFHAYSSHKIITQTFDLLSDYDRDAITDIQENGAKNRYQKINGTGF